MKEAILELVKNEDGNAPLSDKEIVEILSNRGIPIARRTVGEISHRAQYSAEQHAAEVLSAARALKR